MAHWIPAYVALGSNLDGPQEQVRKAVQALRGLPHVAALQVSPLYDSAPLGGANQPRYVNAVTGFLTMLPARKLLDEMLEIERRLGRVRTGEHWGPRRIDLDLLVYGTQRIAEPGLTVPHPGIASRSFVLYPLADIAPSLEIAGLGSVARLRDAIGDAQLRRLD